jgi:hypothetical protein
MVEVFADIFERVLKVLIFVLDVAEKRNNFLYSSAGFRSEFVPVSLILKIIVNLC